MEKQHFFYEKTKNMKINISFNMRLIFFFIYWEKYRFLCTVRGTCVIRNMILFLGIDFVPRFCDRCDSCHCVANGYTAARCMGAGVTARSEERINTHTKLKHMRIH